MRTKITLACTECKQRNYNTTKDKKTHPDRMETKKYCRFCKTYIAQRNQIISRSSMGGRNGRFRRKTEAPQFLQRRKS